jgi:hypothetical protein
MTVDMFEGFFTRILEELHTSMKKDPKYMKYDLDDLEGCYALMQDAVRQIKKMESDVVLVSTQGIETVVSLTDRAAETVHRAIRLGLHKEPENGTYLVDDSDLDSIRNDKYLTGRA